LGNFLYLSTTPNKREQPGPKPIMSVIITSHQIPFHSRVKRKKRSPREVQRHDMNYLKPSPLDPPSP
jgi:hypothetical protein